MTGERSGSERINPDTRLSDADFLVNADPQRVAEILDDAVSVRARAGAAVYRASAHRHRTIATGARRYMLAVDAARFGDQELSGRLTAVRVKEEPVASWELGWATGSAADHRFRHLVDHDRIASTAALDTVVFEGRPVAVVSDGHHIWAVDLATDQPLTGFSARPPSGWVRLVAAAVVDGRPLALAGGRRESVVRIWDLATREPVGDLAGHSSAVSALATVESDGRPLAVSGGWDSTVRVWDLATGRPVGDPLAGQTLGVTSVAALVVDGRPLAVSSGHDSTVRVWDLTTGVQTGDSMQVKACKHMVVTELDGRPAVVTAGDYSVYPVQVRDLLTGEKVGEFPTRHVGAIDAMAAGAMSGRPVVVSGSADGSVQVWDVATGQPIGDELVFPAAVKTLAVVPKDRLLAGFGWDAAVVARR